MSSERAVIELQDVTKIYPMGDETVHALRGVSLKVPKGGYVAIMGSSGSGKSTMLDLLGCLDRPTSGHYFLEGLDVAAMDDDQLSEIRLKHIGFVFQSFHLIPQLTVQENIELPLSYAGIDDDTAALRAIEYAQRVGLGERLGHRPQQLSGGPHRTWSP